VAGVIVLDAILHKSINPALLLLPRGMDSDAARVMLLAIGLQESRFTYRFQKVPGDPYRKGPARGFWQFEIGGARAVMSNEATEQQARKLCAACAVSYDPGQVHARVEFDDVLAAGFARLMLWADPRPLPVVDADHESAWDCYLRCWRPGRPHRHTWDSFHAQARAQVLS
jgi:hypothetical protein